MTIADTLFDACADIRKYLDDGWCDDKNKDAIDEALFTMERVYRMLDMEVAIAAIDEPERGRRWSRILKEWLANAAEPAITIMTVEEFTNLCVTEYEKAQQRVATGELGTKRASM